MSHPRARAGWIAAAACIVAWAAATPARAAYRFELGQSNYTVVANGTVTVSVYLRETETTTLATVGLIAGDFRLLFNDSNRVADPAQAIARILNPAFDSPAPSQPTIVAATATTAGTADIIQSSFDPVLAAAADPGRILLGQFTFQAGLTVGTVTQLRAADLDPNADGLVLANGTILDRLATAGLGTITVVASTAVPEPAAAFLLALGALPALLRAARRPTAPASAR